MRVTRHVDAFQHWKVLEENGDKLKPVLDALNYISSCPWKINKSVKRSKVIIIRIIVLCSF